MNKNNFTKILFIFLLVSFYNHSYSRIVDTIEALENKSIGKEESAPIQMIEFASLTCGHCARFHNEVFPRLKRIILIMEKFFYLPRLSIR